MPFASLPLLAATPAGATMPDALIPEGIVSEGLGGEIADTTQRLIQDWPLETIAIPGVVLIAGVVLWAAGSKLIRPVFAVLGLALGAGVGYLTLPLLGWQTLFGLDSPIAGLIVGGVVGLTLALLLYRLTMGIAAGTALAFAAALAAGVYLNANPTPVPERPLAEAVPLDELTMDGIPVNPDEPTGAVQSFQPRLPEGSYEQARAVGEQFAAWGQDIWRDLAFQDRVILLGATLGALTLGLAFGLAAPKKASILISAPFGATVWLTATLWLLWALFELNVGERVGANPSISLITWVVVSLLGVVVQLGGAKRSDRRKARRDHRDDDNDYDEDEEDE
ncbi:MAG: hypothetical protein AAGK04_05835 [Planctomycetota bacterium]